MGSEKTQTVTVSADTVLYLASCKDGVGGVTATLEDGREVPMACRTAEGFFFLDWFPARAGEYDIESCPLSEILRTSRVLVIDGEVWRFDGGDLIGFLGGSGAMRN